MNPYAKLLLPVQIKNENFVPESVDLVPVKTWPYGFTDPHKSLTPEAYDFFADLYQGEVYVQIHKGSPGFTMPIHIDGRIKPDGTIGMPRPWAINFPFNVDVPAEMHWYREKGSDKDVPVPMNFVRINKFDITTPNAVAPGWHPDVLEAFCTATIDTTSLINIGIPHNVVNHDQNNTRWALSIRPDDNKWSYVEAYEMLRPYFVE